MLTVIRDRGMTKIDTDAKEVFKHWLDFLIPEDVSPKELDSLAKKAKLSTEGLRKLKGRHRTGMSVDTLIRLALSRGSTVDTLVSSLLKVNNSKSKKLDSSEIDWIKYGAGLRPQRRRQFLDFIEYLRKTWNI